MASTDEYQVLMDRLIRAITANSGLQLGGNVVTAAADLCRRLASSQHSTGQKMTPVQEQKMLRELMQHSPEPEKLGAKYEKLKAAGVEGLDVYLQLVAMMLPDASVVKLVSAKRKAQLEPPISQTSSGLTSLALTLVTSSTATQDQLRLGPVRRIGAGSVSHAAISEEDTASNSREPEGLRERSPKGNAAPSGDPDLIISDSRQRTGDTLSEDLGVLELRDNTQQPSSLGYFTTDHVEERKPLVEGVSYPVRLRWNEERPYLTGKHLWQDCSPLQYRNRGGEVDKSNNGVTTKTLGSFPVAVQELLVVDDLMYAMVGIEGKYVRTKRVKGKEGAISFHLDSTMDVSLQELARRILPLCENYYMVEQFAETRSQCRHGLVCHALAAALRELLEDYTIMVAQLEHQFKLGQLSLQGLWFYSQPMIAAMQVVSTLVQRATSRSSYGASLLNLLHTQATAMAGDNAARALLQKLMQAASGPYFNMLERWVYEGVINDPYGEFLIEENRELQKETLSKDIHGTYWQKRYVLRRGVPAFLAEATQAILTTGKYLNAIRECGEILKSRDEELRQFLRPWNEGRYLDAINAAHDFASRELLSLVFKKFDLMGRLRSVKHYFLLDQGDFLVHFSDIANEELTKPPQTISVVKLQSLLELALRTSVSASDPYHEDLTCKLEEMPVIEQIYRNLTAENRSDPAARRSSAKLELSTSPESLGTATGLDTFTLDYKVGWPLSLVISREALHKYQLIFRHLFHCKHVERQLCISWQGHQVMRGLDLLGTTFTRSNFLCQRMVHFMQNLMHYMTFEVLEPNWHIMDSKLQGAKSVDEVMSLHLEFLGKCRRECLLESPKLLKKIDRIKGVCLRYTREAKTQLDRLCVFVKDAEEALPAGAGTSEKDAAARLRKVDPKTRRRVQKLSLAEARRAADNSFFQNSVGALEAEFNNELRSFVNILQSCSQTEPYLAHLAQRLE